MRSPIGYALAGLALGGMAMNPAFGQQRHTRLVQQGIDQGKVTGCADALDEMVRFIYPDDGVYGMHTVWSLERPNGSLFTGTTVEVEAGEAVFATFSAIPVAGGKCDVLVTQTGSSAKPCTTVRETSLKNWKYKAEIAGASVYEEPTVSAAMSAVYLANAAGGGCTLLKRISLFGK